MSPGSRLGAGIAGQMPVLHCTGQRKEGTAECSLDFVDCVLNSGTQLLACIRLLCFSLFYKAFKLMM